MPKRAPLTLREKRLQTKRAKTTKARVKAIGRRLKPAEVRAYLNRIDPPPGSGVKPEVTGEVPEFTEPHVVEHAPGCVTRAEPSAECDCADLNPETTTDVTVSDAPWWKCRRGHLVQAPEWSYQTRSAVAPRGHRLECPKNNHSAMCDSPLPASESMCGCMHKNMWICSCPPDVTTQDTGPLCNECWEIPSVRDEIAAFVAQLMGTKRQEPEAARAEWSRKVLAPS